MSQDDYENIWCPTCGKLTTVPAPAGLKGFHLVRWTCTSCKHEFWIERAIHRIATIARGAAEEDEASPFIDLSSIPELNE